MLEERLIKIGFTKKEAEIYIALLRRGKATPARLAKDTGINRATVYASCGALCERGVIAQDLGGRTLYYSAYPPEDLLRIVDKEKKEIFEKERDIRAVISDLSSLPIGTRYSIPKIKFIEELNFEDYLYKQAKEWYKSAQKIDKIWWGFQDHTFVEKYEKWISWLWDHTPTDVSARLITNQSLVEEKVKGKFERRLIKFWNRTGKFTATVWVVGEYTVMLYTKERPYYLVEIRDSMISHNLREVFKNLWDEIEIK
ncbi:MAG TPA: helix-turn-helix domain-containing protein [Candidatus Paceibacterota bacterium]